MNSKKFLAIFFGVALVVLGCNAFINYKYDMYGVFDKDFTKFRYPYINERYAKMEFLLHEGKGKFDTLILGSSRVKGINPKWILGSTYNLGYSAGLPEDWLRDVKALVEHGVIPKKIYIGIDDFSYKRLPQEVHGNINFIGYSTPIENFKYELSLLLRKPDNDTYRYAFGKLKEIKFRYNISVDGSTDSEPDSKTVDWNKYVHDESFLKPSFWPEKNKRTKQAVNEIRQIKQICAANNIELVLFMTPTHITTYLSDDIDNLNEFKYEIAQVSDFYDFSTINFVTTNNYFWAETSHAGKEALAMVASVLEQNPSKDIQDNFYVYVNKENVKVHLQKMLYEREEYLKNDHEQYVPK